MTRHAYSTSTGVFANGAHTMLLNITIFHFVLKSHLSMMMLNFSRHPVEIKI